MKKLNKIARRIKKAETNWKEYVMSPIKIFDDYVQEEGYWRDFVDFKSTENDDGDVFIDVKLNKYVFIQTISEFVANKFNVDQSDVEIFMNKNYKEIEANAVDWFEEHDFMFK